MPPSFTRMLAALVCGCGLLTACGDDSKELTAPCAVVLDGSKSGTELDVKKLMADHVENFLYDQSCRSVVFVPITKSSEASKCEAKVPPVTLDPALPPGSDVEYERGEALKRARDSAEKMLACAQQDEDPGSDVVGGISKAVSGRPQGSGTYQILVISDFIQRDAKISLYKEKDLTKNRREELVAEFKADSRVPELTGVQITQYGFGLGYTVGPVSQLRAFWEDLIPIPIAAGSD